MTITIRRASTKDAPAFARMMADPAVYPSLLQMPYASEERWASVLGEGQAAGTPDIHLVAEQGSEVIGSAGLHATGKALRRRHAMAMGISVTKEAQGQGVGSALMAALCDYADRWLGILRIELTVYTDNAAGIALYEKFGFEVEGTHRRLAFRDGEYVDAYSMARLKP